MTEEIRPAPLVPHEVDLSGLGGFLLRTDKLLSSELVALCSPEEGWAALMLWVRAWQQKPPASLPNDERVLASFSKTGRRWPKIREMAMRGFVLCSDDRWYHPVLAQEALAAWDRRVIFRERSETANRAKLRKARGDQQGDLLGEPRGDQQGSLEGDEGKGSRREVEGKVRKNGTPFSPPAWIDAEVWSAFKDHRKKRRSPMTDYAMELTVEKLEVLRKAGNDPTAVMKQSIEMGWMGVFPLRDRPQTAASGDAAREEARRLVFGQEGRK